MVASGSGRGLLRFVSLLAPNFVWQISAADVTSEGISEKHLG